MTFFKLYGPELGSIVDFSIALTPIFVIYAYKKLIEKAMKRTNADKYILTGMSASKIYASINNFLYFYKRILINQSIIPILFYSGIFASAIELYKGVKDG